MNSFLQKMKKMKMDRLNNQKEIAKMIDQHWKMILSFIDRIFQVEIINKEL
jgi:hypothetical protein